jgi:hypothetical protein
MAAMAVTTSGFVAVVFSPSSSDVGYQEPMMVEFYTELKARLQSSSHRL